jgi:hypothetical protein
LNRIVVTADFARLHQRRMQKQVVRHDGGSDHADGHHQHASLTEAGQEQGPAHFREVRLDLRQHEDLDAVTDGDRRHKNPDHRLDHPDAQALQRQQEQHIERRDDDRPRKRDMEKQIEGHRAAQRFRQVRRPDGDLHRNPGGPAGPRRVVFAAALGEIPAGDQPQPGGNYLQNHRHEARQRHHPQQPVFVLRPARQISPPVARIHVPDAHQQGRPGKGPPLPPERGFPRRNGHRTMHLLQRSMTGPGFGLAPVRVGLVR